MPLTEDLPGSSSSSSSSKRWRIIAPVAAVVVAAAAVGVYVAASGSSSSGGASSPEAAVRDAATAITNQDVSGLLDVLNPGEVKSLGSLLDLVRGKIAKTGVVSASGKLEPWASLTVSNLKLTSHSVTSTMSFVEVTGGDFSSTIDQKAMPASIRPANPTTVHRTSSPTADQTQQTEIATIKVSGRWYISPSTTSLAAAAASNGLTPPDFSHPATLGDGSDTPDGALTGFLGAAAKGDYAAAAGFLSSKDEPALPYYYNALAAGIPDTGGQFADEVPRITTSIQDMSNGLKKVVIDSASVDGQAFTGKYNGGCVTSEVLPRPTCIPSIFTKLSGIKDPFVVVEQNNGKWQISATGTMLEYLRVVFADGSTNAFYRVFGLEPLTPVVATLHANQSAPVTLNDAGFAHVHIVGSEGDCVPFSDADGHDVMPASFGPFAALSGGFDSSFGGSGDYSCDGWSIPTGGTFDAVITTSSDYGKTITVDLTSS